MLVFRFLVRNGYPRVTTRLKHYGGTMKVLNVAEKNDAAKNIAGYLSRGSSRKREGLSVYNKIYEFNAELWNQNCEMIMTSVSGHLLNHEFCGSYRKWQGCHPLSLFDAPVILQCGEESSVKIKKTLEREVKKCSALIIWTDCDREGENIGFEIIKVCQDVKPNIRVYRAKFSEITQISVNRALQNLCEPDKAVSDAVAVRSELDLRIGAAFTRFQTLRLQKVFPRTLADMLISYGSCQFPTLGFVVERFLAIERFKSEPYWKLRVIDVRDQLSVEFRWARVRLFEKLPCTVLLDICLENPNATVKKVTSKPKSKWRPLPLDTVELEKQGSRYLHLNAKATMQIAEKLYTQGLISYPRTETNIFPKELNLQPLVTQQTNHPTWGSFAQRLLQNGLSPRQGKKSDQAHPPIHPTKYADNLQGNEAKVYEFVVRHFLACLSKNAVGHETVVEIDIAGEQFTANGLHVLEKNYLEVYVYERWSDKQIHQYRDRETFRPTSIEMVEEKTSPPQLLTEADLITLMDKHGIGTDATHADHIDTIKSRQYIGLLDDKHLMPGKLGIGLVMGYDNMGFQMSKPDLRADLERDLKLICERQKDPQEVLQNQIRKYKEVFQATLERANLIDRALADYLGEQPTEAGQMEITAGPVDVPVLKCPRCGNDMTLRDRRQGAGKYIGCMGFPGCNNAIWFPQTIEGVEILEETCRECPGNPRKLKFKFARNVYPIYGTNYTTCIGGCDASFNELLNIRESNVRRTQSNDTGYESGFLVNSNSSASGRGSNTNSRPSARNTSSSSRNTNSSARNTNASSSARNANSNPGASNFPARNSNSNPGASNFPARNSNPSGSSSSASGSNLPGNRNPRRPPTGPRQKKQDDDDWSKVTSGFGDSGASSSNPGPSETDQTWGRIDQNSVIMCYCHENAIQLTVRKEGPNQGRLFYKCAKPQGTGCDFFLWADSSGTANTVRTNQTSQANQNRTVDWARPGGSGSTNSWGNNDSVKCNCNQEAKLLTVQKEGPNRGRKFYGCPKGMTGCGFFQWADDSAPGPSSSNNNNNANNRKRGGGGGGQAQKKPKTTGTKRKCGICGIEGHTRKNCPSSVLD